VRVVLIRKLGFGWKNFNGERFMIENIVKTEATCLRWTGDVNAYRYGWLRQTSGVLL
jgi:hypothetical protein